MVYSKLLSGALFYAGIVFSTIVWAQPEDQPAQPKVDFLSFAKGVIPLSVSGDADLLKTGLEHAISAIDGNKTGFVMTRKPGGKETRIEIVYELPAQTTFSAFAVPEIRETPSPSQTFFSNVEILGSSQNAETGYVRLATHELTKHAQKGQISEFSAENSEPVRWIKMILSGGLSIEREKTYFEFSEIIGHGKQAEVPLNDKFDGVWKGRGVLVDLTQDGSLVSGCYDRRGDLSGSVSGAVLNASGVDRDSGVLSLFILTITPEGLLRGLRSTNGAPFKPYFGAEAPANTKTACSKPAEFVLGCDTIVYGFNFGYDSDVLLPESQSTVDKLFAGLSASDQAAIIIEGHTSSEGSDQYNQKLSERRAQSVVKALVAAGLDQNRISAQGKGEAEPIASNNDEAGRKLNRRVKVLCRS